MPRWPDSFVCPGHGYAGHCVLGHGLFQCRRCRQQTSLTAGVYVLSQELRLAAARAACCQRAQVTTPLQRLLKLGAWVQSPVRRIVLHLPTACVHCLDWQIIARSLGAAPA